MRFEIAGLKVEKDQLDGELASEREVISELREAKAAEVEQKNQAEDALFDARAKLELAEDAATEWKMRCEGKNTTRLRLDFKFTSLFTYMFRSERAELLRRYRQEILVTRTRSRHPSPVRFRTCSRSRGVPRRSPSRSPSPLPRTRSRSRYVNT